MQLQSDNSIEYIEESHAPYENNLNVPTNLPPVKKSILKKKINPTASHALLNHDNAYEPHKADQSKSQINFLQTPDER